MSAPPPPDQPSRAPSSSSGTPPKQEKSRNISVGQILAGILLVLVVIFIVENTETVTIRLIIPKVHDVPVWIALVIAAVLGALIAALMRYRRHRKAKK